MSGPGVFRPADAEAIRLGKTLVRTARSGALATLGPDGHPQATRVGVSADGDGTPAILVSALAAHTPALRAEPRCALLLGQPGKGDPLAHARISLKCAARFLEPGSPEEARLARRYLAHQEKARLYAALPDFRFARLELESAALNAGFGKAYELTAADLLCAGPGVPAVAELEEEAIKHMNEDHPDAVALIARHFAGATDGVWRIAGIDAEGFDLAAGDDIRRVFFDEALTSAEGLRPALAEMTRAARAALG